MSRTHKLPSLRPEKARGGHTAAPTIASLTSSLTNFLIRAPSFTAITSYRPTFVMTFFSNNPDISRNSSSSACTRRTKPLQFCHKPIQLHPANLGLNAQPPATKRNFLSSNLNSRTKVTKLPCPLPSAYRLLLWPKSAYCQTSAQRHKMKVAAHLS